jgi:hypothetical protein
MNERRRAAEERLEEWGDLLNEADRQAFLDEFEHGDEAADPISIDEVLERFMGRD